MRYSIGDVSRVLGMTASALHYYEKEGLIHTPKEDSGWRSYAKEDVHRLISVKNTARWACRFGISRSSFHGKAWRLRRLSTA